MISRAAIEVERLELFDGDTVADLIWQSDYVGAATREAMRRQMEEICGRIAEAAVSAVLSEEGLALVNRADLEYIAAESGQSLIRDRARAMLKAAGASDADK